MPVEMQSDGENQGGRKISFSLGEGGGGERREIWDAAVTQRLARLHAGDVGLCLNPVQIMLFSNLPGPQAVA